MIVVSRCLDKELLDNNNTGNLAASPASSGNRKSLMKLLPTIGSLTNDKLAKVKELTQKLSRGGSRLQLDSIRFIYS